MIEKENSKGETDIYLIGRRDGLKSAFTNVMKMILDFKEENADDSSNALKKEEPAMSKYEILSLLHGLKSSYEEKKKVLEMINRPVKYVTDEYYRKGQINEITDFLVKIEALMAKVEDSTNDSSNTNGNTY